MGKLNRNAPCECGSGKKYKKCCGRKVDESPTAVHYEEASLMQKALLDFTEKNYKAEINQLLLDYPLPATVGEEVQEIYQFNVNIWGTFTQPFVNGDTIFDTFMKQEGSNIVREKTREIVESWKGTAPVLFSIKELISETITLEDIVTKQTTTLPFTPYANQELGIGEIILGYLVDMGTRSDFFGQFISFEPRHTDNILRTINEQVEAYKHTGGKAEEFMVREFLQIFHSLAAITEGIELPKTETNELVWYNEKERETAEMVKQGMHEEGYPDALIERVQVLWNTYCMEHSPSIRKPEAFAAALEYTVKQLSKGEFSPSQTKLAKKYGVGASTLSNRYKEIEAAVGEKIEI
ncbi:SEC-C metal-binding domain-containing protein [Peribacillus loiseleuriae]|nr:SEC-C metal-binding domain-containing protein [Peribacillus loiseleuriae]